MRGRPQGGKNRVLHIWTDDEKKYLEEITPGHHYKEIQKLINIKYNFNFSLEQIKGAISRYKLNTGFNGQFKTDHVPFNKDKKGTWAKGCEKTWFESGHKPHNYLPVGSERINGDGYSEIKIADPNKWKGKHILVWEENNGALPKGYCIIFGDGNRLNLDISNLVLVSRQQLLILNTHKLIQNDADLTRTGVIIADLYKKVSDRKLSERR